jgi:hypothetical protein
LNDGFLGDAMLSAVIAAHSTNHLMEMKAIWKCVLKLCREHLNELGKDYKLIQFIESKVPVNILEKTFMVIFSNHWWPFILTKDIPVKTLFKSDFPCWY